MFNLTIRAVKLAEHHLLKTHPGHAIIWSIQVVLFTVWDNVQNSKEFMGYLYVDFGGFRNGSSKSEAYFLDVVSMKRE
jgi:hypothetical protein